MFHAIIVVSNQLAANVSAAKPVLMGDDVC